MKTLCNFSEYPQSEFETEEFWSKLYAKFQSTEHSDDYEKIVSLGFIPTTKTVKIVNFKEFCEVAKASTYISANMVKSIYGNYIEMRDLEHLLKMAPQIIKPEELDEALLLIPTDERGGLDSKELIKFLYSCK